MIRVALAVAAGLSLAGGQPGGIPATRGLTASSAVARVYDTILDADFLNVPVRLRETCDDDGPSAPAEVCRVLDTQAVWWEIALDPDSRVRDARFAERVERAIAETSAWTRREPRRAEAWFYHGAAYGARAQWRVLRRERLAAARDGRTIKDALERALALDPELHDARFGIGLYRYYAAVAPAALRLLRWLFLLPGGDRRGGLAQLVEARDRGLVVRDEADYQIHRIYLWYEKRPADALAIVRRLQTRHPRNPLFHHLEAEIQDEYFHDAAASYTASTRLLSLAEAREVHEPALASVRARLNMAVQLAAMGDRARAIELLTALVAERPARPHGSLARAEALLAAARR